MSTAHRPLEWLRTQQDEMERALRGLVLQNSFSSEAGNVTRAADQLVELFAMPGLDAERVRGDVAGTHVVFRTPVEGPRSLLVGHHDTVFPPGTFEGFREEGGLLCGPGVLDMKGGLVVVAFALRALSRAGMLARVPVTVCSVADEEVGSPEGAVLLRRLCHGAREALVFEAGRAGDAVITARKGTGGITVTAHGRAAHAGNAHADGVNAIWALCRFVDRVQGLTDAAAGVTVSVGRMEGGTARNTVPDAARCEIDVRYLRAEQGEALLRAMQELAREAEAAVPGSRIHVGGALGRPPLVRTEQNVALMHRYQDAAVLAGLGVAEAPLVGGGSDASTTAAAGVASIDGLGPRGRGFHTKDEFIERETLVTKALALAEFLASAHGV